MPNPFSRHEAIAEQLAGIEFPVEFEPHRLLPALPREVDDPRFIGRFAFQCPLLQAEASFMRRQHPADASNGAFE
ncbi:hypothetical protein D3C85_1526660 [compost metagenome]